MRANRSTSVAGRKAAPLLRLSVGALGVVFFSVTFPATTAAEVSFSPVEVGVGRSVIGGAVAIAVLLARRQPLLPPRAVLGPHAHRGRDRSASVSACFSALALRQVSSVHGAVLTGLIPAATAGVAVWRAGERPRRALLGSAGVRPGRGDRLRRRARRRPSERGRPAAARGGRDRRARLRRRRRGRARVRRLAGDLLGDHPGAAGERAGHRDRAGDRPAQACHRRAPPQGWPTSASISMCVGFFAWYHAMATGGVAAIGRLQTGAAGADARLVGAAARRACQPAERRRGGGRHRRDARSAGTRASTPSSRRRRRPAGAARARPPARARKGPPRSAGKSRVNQRHHDSRPRLCGTLLPCNVCISGNRP